MSDREAGLGAFGGLKSRNTIIDTLERFGTGFSGQYIKRAKR